MVAFYNAADQELYKKYQYLPQEKYRLGLNLPTEAPVVNQGIVNTNAFANSGGDNNFNPAGNMFGEGTAVSPVFGNSYIDTVRREGADSLPAYEKLIQAGGTAPGGLFQTDYFPGIKDELVDASGRTAGQPGYNPNINMSEDAFKKAEDKRGFLAKLINNAKQGMTNLPDWAKTAITAAGMINPFTIIPKLIGKGGEGGPTYGIAGLSNRQKNMYDTLASQGMLYQTPGGMKTFDGKNFSQFDDDTINDYFSGKIDKYGSIEEYEDYLNKDPRRRKNLIKTLQFYKTAKKGSDDFTNFNENINAGNDPTNTYDYGITQGAPTADYTGGGSLDRAIDNARARSDRQDEGKGPAGSSTYNDPYDPGGGEKDGGFIDGTNRRPFAYGGLASIL